ncbi:hypothetical protein [Nitrosovibrio tenuis]|uniref:Uncharacterized protein n=1 Tax=Nitrosovibrio tenuis TaxID=1233 RepID=A0A1H7IXV9_9PROT|nr:hypothetical protein [Nitrosovibrio tenuis]SEK66792.1 hypothetical protein SAMN05216387_102320 [Nitrosovibrio tenuis]
MCEQQTIRPRSTSVVLALALSIAVSGCVTGHEIMQNRVVVPAGAVAKVKVVCPSGKKVLGGGFNIEIPEDVKVYASDPSDGQGNIVNNGWRVMVRNEGATARQATAIAICATAQ